MEKQNFFKKALNFIREKISGAFDLVQEKAPLAVRAVNEIKDIVEKYDDLAYGLAKKTNTQKDDKLLDVLTLHLPVAAKKLAVAEGIISELDSPDSALEVLLQYLKNKAKEGRVKYWVILAAEVLIAILQKNIPKSLAIIATQLEFEKLFGKK